MTTVFVFTDKHVPPASLKAILIIPTPCCTTSRFPFESNLIDLGLVRPVATRAARYPEATVGAIALVGVNVVEQLGAEYDCPAAKVTRALHTAVINAM